MNPKLLEFLLTSFPWLLIFLWTIYSLLVTISKDIRKVISNFYIVESIPNIFVTLGLFGTFTGITYGLLNFDTNPDVIKDSIKILLEGLKSALFTSIAGIFLSLIFSKIVKFQINIGVVKPPESDELITLKSINSNLISIREDTEYNLDKLKKDLINKLDEFLKEMSKAQQDVIVEAFKDILENFNEVLEDFIGQLVDKNFEKLTESIHQLIAWQIEYKKDIQLITESYKSLVNKHEEFVTNTEKWVHNLEEIAGQSSNLQKVVDEFNEAFQEDGNLSLILQKIKDSANALQTVTNDFSGLVNKINDTTNSVKVTEEKIERWTNEIAKVSDTSGQIVDHLTMIQEFRVKDLNSLSDEFNKRLSTTFASFDVLVKAYIEDIEKRIKIDDRQKSK